MATRLYVNTKDALVLEMLADVPRGTYEKYQKIQNLPDSVWQKSGVIQRIVDVFKREDFEGFNECLEGGMTETEALALRTEDFDPSTMKMYWMMYVVSQPVRTMDSFLSEGFGRIQMDESYLCRVTKDVEEGASFGGTKIFTQVAAILRAQADHNRLIFNAEDWTIQGLTYCGEPFMTTGRIDITDTSIWRRGPRVKIAKLDGLHWN